MVHGVVKTGISEIRAFQRVVKFAGGKVVFWCEKTKLS